MTTINCQPFLTSWGDASIAWIAENLRHPLLSPVMMFFTELGQVGTILFTLSLSYWLWNKRYGKYLCYGLFATLLVNLWLKGWIRECRPPTEFWMKKVDIYSFPSGHAQVGILIWWGFAYFTKNRFLSWIYIFIGLMIALSRSYLGVHYLQDILCGALLGAATLVVCILFEKKQYAPLEKLLLWVQSCILLMLFIPFLLLINDPKHIGITVVSTCLGFWLGCQLEEKYIQFQPFSSTSSLIYQILIGAAGIIVMYYGMSWLISYAPLKMQLIFQAQQYFLLGLWISFGAPAICLRFNFVNSSLNQKFN